MALPMNSLVPTGPEERKISVSFLTEAAPTVFEPLETIEPGQPNNNVSLDPALKALQQRILRLQVSQVVLGLTLLVLSSVALIEDRVIFGLGFGIISALIAVFSAIIGIQQCNLRFVAILNILALVALFPTFYFVFENLIRHSRLYVRNTYPPHHPYPPFNMPPHFNVSLSHGDLRHYQATILSQYGGMRRPGGPRGPTTIPNNEEMSNNTLWILCWLELAHLVPLGASLLYLLFLYRYLNYYTHF